jgi:hypothetical protein
MLHPNPLGRVQVVSLGQCQQLLARVWVADTSPPVS